MSQAKPFKAKAEQNAPGPRSRWVVIVAGQHRVCGPCRAGSEFTHFRQWR
jgi:hypothetical protein